MTESWRRVRGHERYYEVSDEGRVRSLRHRSGSYDVERRLPLVLKPSVKKTLHCYVKIAGKKTHVHRLVLDAFVGPCPTGFEGAHYDGNPLNNRLNNLRWTTRADNLNDRVRHGTLPTGDKTWQRMHPEWLLRGERNGSARLTDQQAAGVKTRAASGERQVDIAQSLGVHPATISHIIRGRTWKHLT